MTGHRPWCGTPEAQPGHGCASPARVFDGVYVTVLEGDGAPVVLLWRPPSPGAAVLPLNVAVPMASILAGLGHPELAAAITTLCELAAEPADDRIVNPVTNAIEHLPAGAR